eukprot:GSMAST32.ASY1.ANO1.1272.1 assembled CDS
MSNRPEGQYNILLIVMDQERRWTDLPSGFYSKLETILPGRAKLLRQSVSFDNFFINSAPCTPSRSVMYTGQHFQNTGVFSNDRDLPLYNSSGRGLTVGHILHQNGFRTAYKGKWHLTKKKPNYFGVNHTKSLEKFGFGEWNSMGNFWGACNEGFYQDPITTQEAVDFIFEHAKKPWFLAVNFINPHDIMFFDSGVDQSKSRRMEKFNGKVPFMSPPDEKTFKKKWNETPNLYKNNVSNNSDMKDAYELPLSARHHMHDTDIIFGKMKTVDEFQRNLDFYLNCFVESDRHIVQLLNALTDAGVDQDTIIIFTSDHGEMAGEHACFIFFSVFFFFFFFLVQKFFFFFFFFF